MKENSSEVAAWKGLFDQDLELGVCSWIRAIVHTTTLPNYQSLWEKEEIMLALIELSGIFKLGNIMGISFEKSISGVVKLFADIWRKEKSIYIYNLFQKELLNYFSERFVFEKDFDCVMYSNSREITLIFLVVLFITNTLAKEKGVETNFIKQNAKFSQETKMIFDAAMQLKAELTPDSSEKASKGKSDRPLSRLLEEQENEIARLKELLKTEKEYTADTLKEIENYKTQTADLMEKIAKLEFSKDDLINRLREQSRENELSIQAEAEIKIARIKAFEAEAKAALQRQIEELRKKISKNKASQQHNKTKNIGEGALERSSNLSGTNSVISSQVNSSNSTVNPIEHSELPKDHKNLKKKLIEKDMKILELHREIQQLKSKTREAERAFTQSAISCPISVGLLEIKKELDIESVLEKIRQNISLRKKHVASQEKIDKTLDTAFSPEEYAIFVETLRAYHLKIINIVELLNSQNSHLLSENSQLKKDCNKLEEEHQYLFHKIEGMREVCVEQAIQASKELQDLFNQHDSMETATTFGRLLLKHEIEIARTNAICRKAFKEAIASEHKYNEKLELLMGLLSAYLST